MKKQPAEQRKQRLIRIDPSMWDRIAAYQQALKAKNKLSVNFSEVTRSIIDAGLTALGQ